MTDIEESGQIKPKKRYHFDKILLIILLVLVALFVRKYISQDTGTSVIENEIKDIENRQVYVEIIHHKTCSGKCFYTGYVLDYLNTFDLNLTINERYIEDSEEDQELIDELGVTKLPVVILRENIQGLEKDLKKFNKKNDILFLESPQPPFYYIPNNEILGFVQYIYIKDRECEECSKLGELLTDMAWKMGVGFSEEKNLYFDNEEAIEIIKKYNITKLPVVIFKGALLEYPTIAKTWENIGSIESDGALVLRKIKPPYKNPQTGEVEGFIDVTLLIDKTCKDCYDPEKAVELLKEKYELVLGETSIIDFKSAEGKKLIEKYSIPKVPSFIFSEDAKLYPGLMLEWEKYGIVSADDKLILTKY